MPRICIIAEHDPWEIQLLQLYAERVGYQVVQVFQTQDVLPVAKQVRPEIIVLDSELPGTLSCLEAVHNLGADPETDSIAVLLFAALAEFNPERVPPEIRTCLPRPVTYGAFLKALMDVGIQADGWLPSSQRQERR